MFYKYIQEGYLLPKTWPELHSITEGGALAKSFCFGRIVSFHCRSVLH